MKKEEIKLHKVCLRCGRPLKNSESRILGFGKICHEKYLNSNSTCSFNLGEPNETK